MLVYLLGHRARPSLARRVALVLATTGSTRRRSPGRTRVGRLAVTRDPRVPRLTLMQHLWRNAVLGATTIPVGGDEVTITLHMPTNVEETGHTGPSAQHTLSGMHTNTELRRWFSKQVANSQRHFVGDRQGNTSVFPEATRKETGA